MKSLVIILFFLVSSIVIHPVFAENHEQPEPVTYQLHIQLLDVKNIDIHTGSYELRFLLVLQSDDVDFTQMQTLPQIDFVNGDLDEPVIVEDLEPHIYSIEVDGEFFNQMNFKNYPFSPIEMTIILEPDRNIDEVLFSATLEDPDVSHQAKFVPGWIFELEYDKIDKVEDHDGDIHSRYTVTFPLSRPVLSSFLENLMPLSIIAIMSVFVFFLKPTAYELKSTLSVVLLISLVLFHSITLTEQLPPLDYLTLQDKILTVVYILILYTMAEQLVQRKSNIENDPQKAAQIDRKMQIGLPILIVGSFSALWYL